MILVPNGVPSLVSGFEDWAHWKAVRLDGVDTVVLPSILTQLTHLRYI
jgi:hypothetical protein